MYNSQINQCTPKFLLCFYFNGHEKLNFHPHLQSEDLQRERERERKFELIAKTQSIINSSQQKKKDTGVYKILTSSVKRGDRIINLTFVRGDRDVCDQCVQLVWGIFIFITFPGETHTHAVRHVPEKHATCIQD